MTTVLQYLYVLSFFMYMNGVGGLMQAVGDDVR